MSISKLFWVELAISALLLVLVLGVLITVLHAWMGVRVFADPPDQTPIIG